MDVNSRSCSNKYPHCQLHVMPEVKHKILSALFLNLRQKYKVKTCICIVYGKCSKIINCQFKNKGFLNSNQCTKLKAVQESEIPKFSCPNFGPKLQYFPI